MNPSGINNACDALNYHRRVFVTTSFFLLKKQVTSLPCLEILNPDAFPIIESDAFNIGYGGILKQDFQSPSQNIMEMLFMNVT